MKLITLLGLCLLLASCAASATGGSGVTKVKLVTCDNVVELPPDDQGRTRYECRVVKVE